MSGLFASGGQSIRVSVSASVLPMKYSGMISLRMDLLDLLAVQGKSLLQHHNSKSINSLAFSFLYSPTLTSTHEYWKNHSFDYILTFVDKVMSLLFNMLSIFLIAFLLRSKHLLIV